MIQPRALGPRGTARCEQKGTQTLPCARAAKATPGAWLTAGQRPGTQAERHCMAEDGPQAHDSLSVQAAL